MVSVTPFKSIGTIQPIRQLGASGGGGEYYQQLRSLYGASIIQHLPGWDASGTTAADISGRVLNGLYQGAPVLGVPGIGDGRTAWKVNNASVINAFSAGLASVFSGDEGMLSFWLLPNAASDWTDGGGLRFLAYFGASGSYYYEVRTNGDGTITFIGRRGATTKTAARRCPTTARWVHYSLRWSTSGNALALHINGTKQLPVVQSSLGTWSGALASGTCQWGAYDTSTFRWPGSMAHMILCNAAPTDAQIAQASLSMGQVVFDGDSRSNNQSWTSDCLELAFPSGNQAYGSYGYATVAVDGDSTTLIIARQAATDALVRSGKNIYVLWAGLNDNGAKTAAQIYANLHARCETARAAGWNKVVICTEIDSAEVGWTAKYQALNALINADSHFADAVIPLGAQPELQNNANATYFTDGTHQTAAGKAIIRDTVYPVLAAL